MFKRFRGFALAAVGGGILALGAVFVVRGLDGSGASARPMPPVLQKVQALGELHAAKYTYESAGDYETHRNPAQWATFIPGSSSLVEWATTNRATASYLGTVEAGVDLSQARLTQTAAGKPILHLPAVKLYPAHVEMQVSDVKDGRFWRDNNLVPSAIQHAEREFTHSSLQQGIVQEAEKNVREKVGALCQTVGAPGIEIAFDPAQTKILND